MAGLIIPQRRGLFDYFQQSMRMAVPLILRKNEIDYQKARDDMQYQQGVDQIMADAQQAKFKTATQFLTDAFTKAQAAGDKAGVAALTPKLESYGIPAGGVSAVPKKKILTPRQLWAQKMQEAGASAEQILQGIQNMSGKKGDEKKFIAKDLEQLAAHYFQTGNDKKGQEILDAAAKFKLKTSSIKTSSTPTERKRKALEDDIQQLLGQLGGVESGQNIMTEALGSNRDIVVKRKKKRLATMLEKYDKEYGGAKGRFGITADDFKESKKMPEMPPPDKHKDKIIRDTITGKRYKSDGKKWIEIK